METLLPSVTKYILPLGNWLYWYEGWQGSSSGMWPQYFYPLKIQTWWTLGHFFYWYENSDNYAEVKEVVLFIEKDISLLISTVVSLWCSCIFSLKNMLCLDLWDTTLFYQVVCLPEGACKILLVILCQKKHTPYQLAYLISLFPWLTNFVTGGN